MEILIIKRKNQTKKKFIDLFDFNMQIKIKITFPNQKKLQI